MNIKITDLKKYLSNKTSDEMKQEIIELFKNYKNVQEYFTLKIFPKNEENILKKYKQIIKNEFSPDRGEPKLRYSIMRTAISDFRKVSKNPKNMAELMISHVENGVDFTNMYGDIDEQFYNNIEGMFEKTANYIIKNNLVEIFRDRCKTVYEDSQDIGWGFSDTMAEIYFEYFEE